MPFKPTDSNLGMIRFMVNRGDSVRQIAESVNCSMTCARKWRSLIMAEEAAGQAAQDKRRIRARSYKLTPVQLRRIRRYILANPFCSINQLPAILNIPVNEKTIRRALKR